MLGEELGLGEPQGFDKEAEGVAEGRSGRLDDRQGGGGGFVLVFFDFEGAAGADGGAGQDEKGWSEKVERRVEGVRGLGDEVGQGRGEDVEWEGLGRWGVG